MCSLETTQSRNNIVGANQTLKATVKKMREAKKKRFQDVTTKPTTDKQRKNGREI